jgi:hypothetical protein
LLTGARIIVFALDQTETPGFSLIPARYLVLDISGGLTPVLPGLALLVPAL